MSVPTAVVVLHPEQMVVLPLLDRLAVRPTPAATVDRVQVLVAIDAPDLHLLLQSAEANARNLEAGPNAWVGKRAGIMLETIAHLRAALERAEAEVLAR